MSATKEMGGGGGVEENLFQERGIQQLRHTVVNKASALVSSGKKKRPLSALTRCPC